MKFIDKNTVQLHKVINKLDSFVFKFKEILEKHTDYVIVSGYVAILLGRSRGTDDVDFIIPRLTKEQLAALHKDLVEAGFWCLNSSKLGDLYDLLTLKHSIRFAVDKTVSPNSEVKFSKDVYDDASLKNPLIIKLGSKQLKTSPLELQIAYKEEVLKSNKDLEDAEHLRLIAEGHLNEHLINEYKKSLKGGN
ncbi:hypothetical protein COT48_02410 [Candidatus Woesearchaeota archaeon CG08_land_8_20_14_0_20_47_9]|nr:MAG: hypothetical protein AUJ69_00370 [Candidatus Woesearchaeota archaeon CG1_02_47_18]PIN76725.1 MAG: hypothetical protein COV22_00040 [Candidatus Woesearchaeota archaeon CG10_big_fil_rev_8_21_14_0_10_47_5]PIO04039.1 MAG: hypothetical protein COT48_02410 [Candidatus Woesearchaeota archaeon CG08_land_8_20_14_0_20_47_9]HII29950.1 hypothetical protein [Candidatus Woesearchaeota archaeon]